VNRRRSTFVREPELFILTRGLVVTMIVGFVVVFVAGGCAGLIVGLSS
jgi:hypothetical protein